MTDIITDKDCPIIAERIRRIVQRRRLIEASPEINLEGSIDMIQSILQELDGIDEIDGVTEGTIRTEIQRYIHERTSLITLEEGLGDIEEALESNKRYSHVKNILSERIVHKKELGEVVPIDEFVRYSTHILTLISEHYEPVDALTEFEIKEKSVENEEDVVKKLGSTDQVSRYLLAEKQVACPTKYNGILYFSGETLEGSIQTFERDFVDLEGCCISLMGSLGILLMCVMAYVENNAGQVSSPWLRSVAPYAFGGAIAATLSGPIVCGLNELHKYIGKPGNVHGLAIELKSSKTDYSPEDVEKVENLVQVLGAYRI